MPVSLKLKVSTAHLLATVNLNVGISHIIQANQRGFTIERMVLLRIREPMHTQIPSSLERFSPRDTVT
jgi:hypothetical protein